MNIKSSVNQDSQCEKEPSYPVIKGTPEGRWVIFIANGTGTVIAERDTLETLYGVGHFAKNWAERDFTIILHGSITLKQP